MKKLLIALSALLFAVNALADQPAKATKTDYSKIHGVCYTGWRADEAIRQFAYHLVDLLQENCEIFE